MKAGILLALILAFVLGIIKVYAELPDLDEQITHLSMDNKSNLYIVLNNGNANQIIKLDKNQKIVYTHTLKKAQKDQIRKFEDLKIDSEGNLYVLMTLKNIHTHRISQEIVYLDTKNITGKEQKIAELEDKDIFYEWFYRGSNIQDTSLILVGYNASSQKVIQDKIQFNEDKKVEVIIENMAAYSYPKDQGIYQFFTDGEILGCISMAGEIYKAANDKMLKLLPKGINGTDQVISYTAKDAQGNLYVGEQKSGNLLQLDLNRNIALLKNRASENITKSSQFTYKDVYHLAMDKEYNFAVAIRDQDMSQIIVINQDQSMIYNKLNIGLDNVLKLGSKYFIVYFLTALGVIAIGLILIFSLTHSKTVLYKLIFVTLPITGAIIGSVGILVYHMYTQEITSISLDSIKETALITEKNMSKESLKAITGPASYKSLSYKSLEAQLNHSKTYNRLLSVKDQNIYILIDEAHPFFYKLQYFVKLKDLDLYDKAIKTQEVQQGIITDAWGSQLTSIVPIMDNNEVIALLEISSSKELINDKVRMFFYRLSIFMAVIIGIMSILLILIFRKVLMPLKEMTKILKGLKDQKTTSKIPYRSQDEFFTISQTINTMIEDIQVRIYHLSTLSEKYFRFVPKKLFFLFNKKNISELELGDRTKVNISMGIIELQYKKEKTLWEKKILERINTNFASINQKIDEYEGILADSNRELSELTVVYPHSADKALECALVIADQLKGIDNGIEDRFITLLDKAEVEFGIGGDDTRLSVVILSKRMEKLYEYAKVLKESGCHVILTEEAYKKISNTDIYEFRYIGYIRQDDQIKINLYEFFQSDLEEIRKAKQDSKELFKEALNSFYERDFYKAKNLFSLVLKKNNVDEVAKWYVFRAAYLCQYGTSKDDLNIVPYLK